MTSIEAKINRGLGKGAASLGQPCWLYHPTDPLAPLARQQSGLPASFDTDPHFSHRSPAKYGQSVYYGLFDVSRVQTGDHLVGETATYFVAALEFDRPAECVRCNAVLTVTRPAPEPAGSSYYSGDLARDETVLMAGWPGSVLQGLRGEKGSTGLPDDTRMPWWEILIAAFGGIELQANDRLADDIGRRMTVSSSERTSHGWRIAARQDEN